MINPYEAGKAGKPGVPVRGVAESWATEQQQRLFDVDCVT